MECNRNGGGRYFKEIKTKNIAVMPLEVIYCNSNRITNNGDFNMKSISKYIFF